jgi:hypothetical protein
VEPQQGAEADEGREEGDKIREGTEKKGEGKPQPKNRIVSINMFLDSGATESNYVRQDVVSTLLRNHPNKHVYLLPQPTNVCGAFGQCQMSSHCIKIIITMPSHKGTVKCNDNKNKNVTHALQVPLTLRVMRNLPYDIIVGRPDIEKYDLWYLLRAAGKEEHTNTTSMHINTAPPPPTINTLDTHTQELTIANQHGATLVNIARKRTAEAEARAQSTELHTHDNSNDVERRQLIDHEMMTLNPILLD